MPFICFLFVPRFLSSAILDLLGVSAGREDKQHLMSLILKCTVLQANCLEVIMAGFYHLYVVQRLAK